MGKALRAHQGPSASSPQRSAALAASCYHSSHISRFCACQEFSGCLKLIATESDLTELCYTEIVEFCRALTPTSEEVSARSEAIARVTEIVQTTWPSAEVQIFGSFVTGRFPWG